MIYPLAIQAILSEQLLLEWLFFPPDDKWEQGPRSKICNPETTRDISSTLIVQQTLPGRIHHPGSVCLRHLGEGVNFSR